MVPSTLLGLALFVVLLAPGFAYVLRSEGIVPVRPQSVFRETVRVIFASVICLAIAGLMMTGLRWLLPEHTLDVGSLVRDPGAFGKANYVAVAWWAILYLVLATVVAWVGASPKIIRWLSARSSVRIRRSESAWYTVFHKFDADADAGGPRAIVVGAQLDDGTYVCGQLHTFQVDPEESGDRDILLSAPLRRITVDGINHPMGAQFAVISGRKIVRLDVTHLPSGFRFEPGEWGLVQLEDVMRSSLLDGGKTAVPEQRNAR